MVIMKKHFGKLLTEKGKTRTYHSGHGDRGKKQLLAIDDLPKRQTGMSRTEHRHYSGGSWKPLTNAVRSAIGRPWDKVFSEIKERINTDNYEQQRLLDTFLRHEMCLKVVDFEEKDGQKVPVDAKGDAIYNKLWIHPTTGLVMAPLEKSYKKKNKVFTPSSFLRVGSKYYRVIFPEQESTIADPDERQAELNALEGFWYEVDLFFIETYEMNFSGQSVHAASGQLPKYDVVSKLNVQDLAGAQRVDGRYAVAVAKRQLNGREIEKLGLKGKFAGVRPNDRRRH
jgi:hypothetical protein